MKTSLRWVVQFISVTWILNKLCGASVSSTFYIYTDETLPESCRVDPDKLFAPDHQYGVRQFVYPYLLNHSKRRFKPRNAEVFVFVPPLGEITRHRKPDSSVCRCLSDAVPIIRKIAGHRKPFPRHVIYVGIPMFALQFAGQLRKCLPNVWEMGNQPSLPYYSNMTWMSIEPPWLTVKTGPSHSRRDSHVTSANTVRHVGVPYPNNFPKWQSLLSSLPRPNRSALWVQALYGHNDKHPLRATLRSHCRKVSQCLQRSRASHLGFDGAQEMHEWLPSAITSNATVKYLAHLRLFMRGVFCAQPWGTSPTRASTFQCMIAGGIPVFFSALKREFNVQVFSYLFDGPWCVLLNSTKVVMDDKAEYVLEQLSSVPASQVQMMQNTIANAMPKITYSLHGPLASASWWE